MAKRFGRAVAAVAVALGAFGGGIAEAAHTATNEVLSSKVDQTPIAITIFKPEAASAQSPVPMILHSHGWGGTRATSVDSMKAWLDAGFGVLSFDQRGHGETGGEANVEDPDLEGYDVETVIDRVAALDWVQMDAPGDPVLGAIGGSYGGGYQTMGALSEILHNGNTRFNALSPEITWYHLSESLAPQGVPRTLWTTLLYAVAPPHASYIDEAEAVGLATGWFPDGTIPGTVNLKQEFYEHSPAWFPAEKGIQLDIPVLFGQGITDNLFNLNQGIHNFQKVLTDGARSKSILVGYNGGHVLPEALPNAKAPTGNACVSNWGNYQRAFFAAAFAGLNPRAELDAEAYNIATNDAGCIRGDTLGVPTEVDIAPANAIAINTTAGAPLQLEVAKGPLKLSGIPNLKGTLTTAGFNATAFFALAVGTNPADAVVIQNNVMPVRRMLPTAMEQTTIELPGIAVELAAGQSLFLTVSPIATHFLGNSARTPGAVALTDAVLELPVVS